MTGQFRSGLLVNRLRLADGKLLQVSSFPLPAIGHVEFMTVVMQPAPGGEAPWVQVRSGEGAPEYYVNLVTVQEVELTPESTRHMWFLEGMNDDSH